MIFLRCLGFLGEMLCCYIYIKSKEMLEELVEKFI